MKKLSQQEFDDLKHDLLRMQEEIRFIDKTQEYGGTLQRLGEVFLQRRNDVILLALEGLKSVEIEESPPWSAESLVDDYLWVFDEDW